MKSLFRLSCKLLCGLCLSIGGLLCIQIIGNHNADIVHAQSAVDSIKSRIRTVVANVDGKVSLETKNRLITVISNKIKASTNAAIVDIYVFFLKEVKKLRTSDQIVSISAGTSSSMGNTNNPSTANTGGPDFMITFANIVGSVQSDQKFATLTVKVKNAGTAYSSDGLGSLKFGCKGIDGAIYPYWSYLENSPPIARDAEVVFEVPNVYIGNLTSSMGYKLLVCKIDSADLISESNEQNNLVSVGLTVN